MDPHAPKDFGTQILAVARMLAERIPATLELAIGAVLRSLLLGIL